jgi:hypothetical protein
MLGGWGAQPESKRDDSTLLRDFVHYVYIDRLDLAQKFGDALLKRLPKPYGDAEADKAMKLTDLLTLLNDPEQNRRFQEAVSRAQRSPETEAVAARLLNAFEGAKLSLARNPDEISKNIALLTGTQQQRLFARGRLVAAGEYAMPQLLDAFTRRAEPALRAEVRQVMLDLSRQAIMPLAAALPKLDPSLQEQVAGIMGDIRYPASRPFLDDLRASTSNPAVRSACEGALAKLIGTGGDGASTAGLYVALAEGYYAESVNLLSFPRDNEQILWSFDPGIGLVMTEVATRVFHEAMAMRLCERALELESGNGNALSLWLASNFSRQIDSPEGYENPSYAKDRKDATFYAVAAGPAPTKAVLARAIDGREGPGAKKAVPMARLAIAAIEKTAGAASLLDSSGRNPLLECLRFPNRRVQYDAAIALAVAQPTVPFDGAERVVPILASAIRDAGAKYAVVVAANAERQQSLASLARDLGYTVVPAGDSLRAVEPGIAEVPGIDLVLADTGSAKTTEALIAEVRAQSRLGTVPVMALLPGDSLYELAGRYDRDGTIRIVRTGANAGQQAEAVSQLVDTATGGAITTAEAAAYQARALTALRDLAVGSSTVFNVADASGPLITVLGDAKRPDRMQVADVLSRIGDKRVQSALMDAALASAGDDMIALLGKVSSSAKRFTNLLDDAQVERLRKAAAAAAARPGADAEATALAGLMGSLNLPNEKLIPLILNQPKAAASR